MAWREDTTLGSAPGYRCYPQIGPAVDLAPRSLIHHPAKHPSGIILEPGIQEQYSFVVLTAIEPGYISAYPRTFASCQGSGTSETDPSNAHHEPRVNPFN
jgi:hypothetical protein